jgi:DNA-binding NtrC family response regulator
MQPTRPKILVVDDDLDLLKALKFCLQTIGCEVLTAANGIEAFELLTRENVTLVLTDIRMPRLDGMALLEAINKMESNVPVVVMTGEGVATERDVIKRKGLMLLRKPFEIRQIHEIISLYAPDLPALNPKSGLRQAG